MSTSTPAAPARHRPRYLDALLRIVAEPSPAAHYQCLLCPYTESVRGRARTVAFAASIRTSHRATCPANTEEHSTT